MRAVLRLGLSVVLLGGAGLLGAPPPASGQPLELAQAEPRPLVSGERVRVKKLARDMESAMQTLNQNGIAPFQDPAYVEKWQQSLERYRTALARYPQTDDPDVQAAAAKLGEFSNLVAFGISKAQEQIAELGDVQAIMATIETELRANSAPAWLPVPFSEDEARAWLRRAADAQQTARQAIAALQRIAPLAHLPLNPGTVQQGAPYDRHDLDRLYASAESTARKVQEAVQQTEDRLKHQFQAQDEELNYFRQLDPDNPQQRANAFLRQGVELEIYQRLDQHLALARSLVAYQRAFNREPTASSLARAEEIAGLRATYAANRTRALGESTLPDAQSTDAGRLAIAAAILAEPRYEFGEHGPIVLTTPETVERQKQVSRAEIKDVDVSLSGDVTFSGTETTWRYHWQEFKFATPLKETDSDEWYIWWITAKRFLSGAETTPLNRWVSGAATRGDRILAENF